MVKSQDIDQTMLKPGLSEYEFKKWYDSNREKEFRALIVRPEYLGWLTRAPRNSRIGTVVDFPNGLKDFKQKGESIYTLQDSHFAGCLRDFDVVLGKEFMQNYTNLEQQYVMKYIESYLHGNQVIKYIVELEETPMKDVLRFAHNMRESPLFLHQRNILKTSTGKYQVMDNIPFKKTAIEYIKSEVPDVVIKASGGIRTSYDADILLQAGANIIGTSSGLEMLIDDSVHECHY